MVYKGESGIGNDSHHSKINDRCARKVIRIPTTAKKEHLKKFIKKLEKHVAFLFHSRYVKIGLSNYNKGVTAEED